MFQWKARLAVAAALLLASAGGGWFNNLSNAFDWLHWSW